MQNFHLKEFVRIYSLFAKKQTKVFLQVILFVTSIVKLQMYEFNFRLLSI